MVTLVIQAPTGDVDITSACVKSLLGVGAEIRVVPWIGHYGRAINLGLKNVYTDFVGAANADLIAPKQWLQLLNHKERDIGIICPDEATAPSFDPAGEIRYGPKDFFGGFWIMPTTTWQRLGGMDERFDPIYCEDSDLLYRVEQAKYKIVQDRRVKMGHMQSHFIKQNPAKDLYMRDNVKRFWDKHGFDPITYQH